MSVYVFGRQLSNEITFDVDTVDSIVHPMQVKFAWQRYGARESIGLIR